MQRRRFFIITVATFCWLLASLAHAQLPQINSGLSYLSSSQNADGTWQNGTTAVESTTATVTVLDTLKLTGQIAGTPYTSGTAWLQGQSPQAVALIAQRNQLLGLSDTTALSAAVDTFKGGLGGYDGYEPNPLDTSLVLQTLKSTDQSIIFPALSYLLSTQNPDGGWGFTGEDASNVFVTAHVLSTLAQYKTEFLAETQAGKAVAFLLSRQQPDGGFGSESSSVYETALAFSAIVDSGQTQGLPLQNAISFLTATQAANGSWNDDPYSTALALQALARVKPDLTLAASDINVTPATPAAGNSVIVTATIRNAGLDTAAGVTVRLTDNGAVVAEQTVSAISPGGTAQVAFAIPAITPYGDHNLGIVIDPANAIAELNETNNTASTRIWARSAADLVVYPEYLATSPDAPKPGETITLTAMVANMGESAAQNVTATLYDGDPVGGVTLGSFTIAAIDSGSWGSGTVSFSLATAGSHDMTLVVDPQQLVSEESRGNNSAVKTVTVTTGGAAHSVDLIIPPTGLQITPSRPRAGESVTVTATAQNLGNSSATADLELFEGDPASGVLLHRSTLTLSAGETRTVAVPWTVGAGIHSLRAYLDRAALVTETDKLNNSRTLVVMADMVDIEISASDISISPEHPMAGDPATVKVTVQNRGILPTGHFTVNLFNGDPAAGGVLLQSFEIADLAGDAAQELIYSFTASSGTYRFYAVCDPDSRVAEMYEGNNLAIRSLLVKSSAEAKGPDLVPLEFDLSAAATDPQSLRISGFAKVKFQNKGDDKVVTPFRITVFEDRDGDGLYSEGTDSPLGFWDYSAPLNPGMVGEVTINIAGTLTFRDAPIYAMVDSSQTVFEQDEANNAIRKGSDCEARPYAPIEPALRWRWPRSGESVARIMTTPVVMRMTDDNRDGQINDKDIPNILINAPIVPSTLEGKVWALRGDSGVPNFSIYDVNHLPSIEGPLAVADIDGDGRPEIVTTKQHCTTQYGYRDCGIMAFNSDGTIRWDNQERVRQWNIANPKRQVITNTQAHPTIADLDGDGTPEIISGIGFFKANGDIRCAPAYYSGVGSNGNVIQFSPSVGDLDLDSRPEVLTGNTAYNGDCSVKWMNTSLPDGTTALGNFDDDPYPEIVLVSHYLSAKVYMLEHDGSIKWGPVSIASLEGTGADSVGGQPIIADFDGDGKPEIGVRGAYTYFILDGNGAVKGSFPAPIIRLTSELTVAPTVFDLNGDGRPEILIATGGYFKVFDGRDQRLLYQDYVGQSSSLTQNVIVADVDGDGQAEVVVVGMDGELWGTVRVYGAKTRNWVSTRAIWNQESYHVTNIKDNGSIPANESPSWLLNNNYRCNVPTTPNTNPYRAADLSVSFLRVEMADYPRSIALSARIGNGGALAAASGMAVSFHDGDPAGGGQLLGSALTTKSLSPGEYEDVTLVWSAPVGGEHTVFVQADPARTVAECNRDNNLAQLTTFLSSGQPDLSVTPQEILFPAPIMEGSLTPLSATIRNSGTRAADNVLVRFYAGNPATGGTRIGADQVIASLAANGATTVQTVWNTLGAPGTTYLYVVVDPQATIAETNRGNNTGIREVVVLPATKPDLQIGDEDITITPAAPAEGEPVLVTVNVHNRGVVTGNVKGALYLDSAGSGLAKIGEVVHSPPIPLGAEALISFSLDTVGRSGSLPLVVVIDPDNVIDESSETNNRVTRKVTVEPSGLTLGVHGDKTGYPARTDARLAIEVANTKPLPRNLLYEVYIVDERGVFTSQLSVDTPLSVGPNGTTAVTATWNTGTYLAGTYGAVVLLKEGGRTVAKASASVVILPTKTVTAVMTTSKLIYDAGETIPLSARIASTSENYQFENLAVRLSVNDGDGTPVFGEIRTIAALIPGGHFDLKSWWNSTGARKVSYIVTVDVVDGTSVIASGQSMFTLSGTAASGAGVTGTVTLQPSVIDAGAEAGLSFSIANHGNEDIPVCTVRLLIIDTDSGQNVQTIDLLSEVPLGLAGTRSGSYALETTGLNPRSFLAILQYVSPGITKTLASSPFTVADHILPVLLVSTLPDGAYTKNGTLNVAGTATDNTGVQLLQINGVAVPLATDDSFSLPLVLNPGANAIEVKAVDLANNQAVDNRKVTFDPFAPNLELSAPADNGKTASASTAVSGSVDESSTVTVRLGDTMQTAAMSGMDFSAGVNLLPGWNTIEVTATDLAGNTSSLKRSVLFDDQKPSLEISEPSQDMRTNKGSLTIAGKASDPYSAVGITLSVDGAMLSPTVVDGIFSQVVSFGEEKLYPIVVTATNEVGTQTTAQRNVIYDRTPPLLTIDPVTSPTNAALQVVSGTREEDRSVTVACTTAAVGEVEYPTPTTWRVALSGLQPGENRLEAASADLAGNGSLAAATILYLPKAPEVTVTATPNQLWPPDKKLVPVVISGEIMTFGADVASVTVNVADEYGKYNQQGLKFGDTVWLEAWRDGSDKDGRLYTITAVVTDLAGNVTTRTATVIVPHDMGR